MHFVHKSLFYLFCVDSISVSVLHGLRGVRPAPALLPLCSDDAAQNILLRRDVRLPPSLLSSSDGVAGGDPQALRSKVSVERDNHAHNHAQTYAHG